jgi:hypothetical protein
MAVLQPPLFIGKFVAVFIKNQMSYHKLLLLLNQIHWHFQYQENWQSLASLILFATNGQLRNGMCC